MSTISNSEDVYRLLVEESKENWILGLLAFAIVEEQRFEWMEHVESNHGKPPSADEIQHWYEQQPESVLIRARGTAENALIGYADEVLQEVLETERKEVSESVIVSEIRSARRFWPQFGINVAGGLAAALLFGAILAILAFIVWADPSPIEIGRGITKPQVEEGKNGDTNRKPRSNE